MKRNDGDRLLGLVQSFFTDQLRRVQGASEHTVRAYGQALRLFFLFLATQLRRSVAHLRLEDLTADRVLAFLDDLETSRGNVVITRNCRLAALHAFFEYVVRQDVEHANEYRRILSIRTKRFKTRAVQYLEPEQVRAIVAQPNRNTASGRRDYAMLMFLYNTGARVSEALAVTRADLYLSRPYHVRLFGKGRKERICPLWPETAKALSHLPPSSYEARTAPVFRNSRNGSLTRDGVAYLIDKYVAAASKQVPVLKRHHVTPHLFRHSCAVALLQGGVDITVIRDYLGHASVRTTDRYVSTNAKMKRDALDAFWKRAGITGGAKKPWRPTPNLLTFLSSL